MRTHALYQQSLCAAVSAILRVSLQLASDFTSRAVEATGRLLDLLPDRDYIGYHAGFDVLQAQTVDEITGSYGE